MFSQLYFTTYHQNIFFLLININKNFKISTSFIELRYFSTLKLIYVGYELWILCFLVNFLLIILFNEYAIEEYIKSLFFYIRWFRIRISVKR